MGAPPLVIFGLDAANPELVLRWASDGSLPAISALLQRGGAATLKSAATVSAHEVWASVFSGVPLAKHGYYLRRVLMPGTYRLQALRPEDIPAPPFWSKLRETDRSALIVDVPDVPLLPGLRGSQVLGWGEHPTPRDAQSLPTGILAESRRLVGRRISTDERQVGRAWDRWVLRQILARVERKRRLCELLLRRSTPEVTVVVFGDSHAAGHRFSRYRTGGSEATHDDLESAIFQVYRAIDRAIGDLLSRFSEAPNVILVSNGGIRSGCPIGPLMEQFCAGLGYTTRLSSLRRQTGKRPRSRWRQMLERAEFGSLARFLQRAPDLQGIDWANTTAFLIPSDYTGYFRVNLAGREPRGIVTPGADYESLLERLEADLRQLVEESTGDPVIERIVRASSFCGGKPPQQLPDLFVEWRSHRAGTRRIRHPRAVLERRGFWRERDNRHSREGLVVAAGPSLPPGRLPGALAPVELAPLFLELMGEPASALLFALRPAPGLDEGRDGFAPLARNLP